MLNVKLIAREGSLVLTSMGSGLVLTSMDGNFFNFGHYSDHKGALNITNKYLSDAGCVNGGIIHKVNNAVLKNNTCVGLDITLDTLFQQNVSTKLARRRGRSSDDNENDIYALARKHYENSLPLLVP